MTTLTLPFPRDEVIDALGPYWPIREDAALLRVDTSADQVTDGAVVVYPVPGRPGYLWWLIDGVIPQQAAGEVTAELAEQIPGSVLELPPPDDEPPAPPN